MLHYLDIGEFTTRSGCRAAVRLSYEQFGLPLHSAPVVLVNHALTGNSHVSGDDGWWSAMVGPGRCIDTHHYTVLCFNVPGNGYDGMLVENYRDWTAGDIAAVFLKGLDLMGVDQLFALIGGSLGGGLAWEMAVQRPRVTRHLIPVAADWKATDWLIANCQIQEQILLNSRQPVQDARMHAMLCYRTPASFKSRFRRSTDEVTQLFNVETWLIHHGRKLQERFQLAAYKLANQLLKTIDVNRQGPNALRALQESGTQIHIIGVDSDLFFVAEENQETYRQLARTEARVTYGEIRSIHGHDAFLIEFEQLRELLDGVFRKETGPLVLKFGGRSLANGEGLARTVEIIRERLTSGARVVVVHSARAKATDRLEELLELARQKKPYREALQAFIADQQGDYARHLPRTEFSRVEMILDAVSRLGHHNPGIRDRLWAEGELLASHLLLGLLEEEDIPVARLDCRELIFASRNGNQVTVDEALSRTAVKEALAQIPDEKVALLQGFIATDPEQGETLTLGRNGSNYSAALIANFTEARELQNFTHVDGIYTADPELVPDARPIENLSYEDANELIGFGASILHAKTLIPLVEKNIPLRVVNTFRPDHAGTLISADSQGKGIRALSTAADQALIVLEGRGLLGKSGVDARIFGVLGKAGISVGIIAQGASERGIGLVVKRADAEQAKQLLQEEFMDAFQAQDIDRVSIAAEVAVISIIGQDLADFHSSYSALVKNQVVPLLFNNTVTGRNICLVVHEEDLHKAVNVVHGQVFGVVKRVNLAIFGHGHVGGTLLDQLNQGLEKIARRKGIQFNIFAIANSRKLLTDRKGAGTAWRSRMAQEGVDYTLEDLVTYARDHHLENLVAVDNTASQELVQQYDFLLANGFDLVSSNKLANTGELSCYRKLREQLARYRKQYRYETNVGAGLPLIDTIALLHLSGENITRIRGIFSGSLSYLFNAFSGSRLPFSQILRTAIDQGLTEPDPREDLSGADVGRKLLILARELDLENEMQDVHIENLIPEQLRAIGKEEFLDQLTALDPVFEKLRAAQAPGFVLRYVGELSGDLQKSKGDLGARLVSVPETSVLGRVAGSDSIIEIFTDSYGEHPLVIQGAGAGAAVTARGVLGDLLRIAQNL